MWKYLYDSLSRATPQLINAEQWSSDKCMIHVNRSEVNVDSFTEQGKHAKIEHYLNAKGHFSIINQKQLLLKLILIFA